MFSISYCKANPTDYVLHFAGGQDRTRGRASHSSISARPRVLPPSAPPASTFHSSSTNRLRTFRR